MLETALCRAVSSCTSHHVNPCCCSTENSLITTHCAHVQQAMYIYSMNNGDLPCIRSTLNTLTYDDQSGQKSEYCLQLLAVQKRHPHPDTFTIDRTKVSVLPATNGDTKATPPTEYEAGNDTLICPSVKASSLDVQIYI